MRLHLEYCVQFWPFTAGRMSSDKVCEAEEGTGKQRFLFWRMMEFGNSA